jgi:hypothetical protein
MYRCFILRSLNISFRKDNGSKGDTKNQRNLDAKDSHLLLSGRDLIGLSLDQKEMVEELKIQWSRLWQERVDDKVRAEGMATADYFDLFVEKGTVIHATRDFKALSFREILEQHQIINSERYIPPSPQVGGWNKFIKTSIANQPRRKRRAELYREEIKVKQQPKKGGRGWLHK